MDVGWRRRAAFAPRRTGSGSDGRHPEWLEEWRAFPSLAAVRLDNLYAVPPELVQRHTPRLLDGAEAICTILDEVRAKPAR